MNLRDQIAAKSRRRVRVPVQVSDPGPDEARAAEARALLHTAGQQSGVGEPERAALVRALEDAVAAVRSHFVLVEFAALDPVDFEALITSRTNSAGDVDRDALRAELAAACAVDEDLREADWWSAQFTSGSWTKGELDDLYHQLFTVLNYSVPGGAFPKG